MWVVNLESVAWASKTIELPGIVWEKITFNNGNDGPKGGLKGHSACSYQDKMIILFGGKRGDDGSLSNEVHVFDT